MAQDAYVQELVKRLKRVLPYRGRKRMAAELGMSGSHLKSILEGRSDVGAVFRANIAAYLAQKEAATPVASDSDVDSAGQESDTMTAPGTPPPLSSRSEATLPTPSHAAICELLSMLPATLILQMIPDVTKKVQDYIDGRPPSPPPPPSQQNKP